MKRIAGSLLIALMLGALLTSPTLAAKGGHKGGPHLLSAPAACSVAPDPATVGDLVTATIAGVTFASYPNVFWYDRVGVQATGVMAQPDGSYIAQTAVAWDGLYAVEVRDYDATTGAVTVLATCSFEVIAP